MAFHSKQVPISSKNSHAARNAHARAKEAVPSYDTSFIRPKRSKAPLVIVLIVLVVLAAAGTAFYFLVWNSDAETLSPGQEAIVTIEQGEGARDVADSLLEAKLIGNARKFVDLVSSENAASSLIPGVYQFEGGTSMNAILDALTTGPAATADTLTIPEGYTRANVAKAVAEATHGRISEQEFLSATAHATAYATDYPFLVSAGDASLEGFLFPKTYSVTAADDAASVTKMMLKQFGEEISGLDFAYPESQELSLYGAVELASIVQKEGKPENYARVASVFYNRLASERPYLESDATTAYEVGHDPTGEEVHADTPYSTYTHPGLPPTPICNPSIEAIKAVCAPETTDYMYFYSFDDGTYEFSKTYEQHQRTYS